MDRSEKWKTQACFVLFGCVVLAVFGRLLYLQVGRSDANRRSVVLARDRVERLAPSRGEILDRRGHRLAYDRPTLRVRAEFQARVPKGTQRIPGELIDRMAGGIASQLIAGYADNGYDKPPSLRGLTEKLGRRMRSARHRRMPSKFKKIDYLKVDFLVDAHLDSYESARRLRREAKRWQTQKKLPGRLHLTIERNFLRTYPHRELTRGVVGNYYVARNKNGELFEEFDGLESCRGLWPPRPSESEASGVAGARRGRRASHAFFQLDYKDSKRRRFWTGVKKEPAKPARLESTLDIDLQELACAELETAAAEVARRYKGSTFEWGALVLCDIKSGGVLAMASHYPGREGAAPFAPVENTFEPGSVVKPLVLALALERGVVGWDETFDCTPTTSRLGRPVRGFEKRIIRDDHACGELTPHGIIVNSSNIGAVMIGSRLGRTGMKDYMLRYAFCRKTGIGIPAEVRGLEPEGRIENLDTMLMEKFGRFTGPSLSFGYEMNVTAVQLARAYLTMLSGRSRRLHLVRAFHVGDKEYRPAPEIGGEGPQVHFLSQDTIAKVRAAMVGVVSPDEHATGRHLYKMIDDLGHAQPLVGGKTGTSDSPVRGTRAKTATFVGFAPADAPRYLVVCVLRKDRAVRFYGGSYAALPAGRLLLGALAAEKENRAKPIGQVRVR